MVSPSKSALIMFSRKRNSVANISIALDGLVLRLVQSHKFLGVILDHKLQGHEHVHFLTRKCKSLVSIIRALRGTWWGASPKTLLTIFKGLIRGSVEYGNIVFPIHNASLLEPLERVQRRAL